VIAYLDASALVKRYVVEDGTVEIVALLNSGSVPCMARIGHVETASAIARRARDGVLTVRQRDQLLKRVAADLAECRVVELTSIISESSIRLLRKHPLRAADSIHLASALWVRDDIDDEVRFVCADSALARVAGAEGLDTLIPGSD
jgi:uncharacterized protein